MIKVICFTSKKGNICYALTVNDVWVTFDPILIARATKLQLRDIFLLESGESIEIK